MKQLDVTLDERTETGKGPNYRLRTAGRIPAVLYGAGQPAAKVSVNYKDFETLMKRADASKALFNLTLGGDGGTAAVIREIQRDPVTRRFLHLDLLRIRMDQMGVFEVAVHGHGVPVGVREGGVLETHLRVVDVRCLPGDLPTSITVDLAGLAVNHSLHASELPLPENVTLVTPGTETVYTILAPKGEAAAAAGVAAAAAPEVIGKKKPEEAKAGGDAKKK